MAKKKDKKDKDNYDYYCGAGDLPRGKTRAPLDYCIQHNQVRYYGLVAIDKKLLTEMKTGVGSLTKEKIKLQGLSSDAKLLMGEFKGLKLVLKNPNIKSSDKKKAQKRKETFQERKKDRRE